MSVIVDSLPVSTDSLGLQTVGQLLAHLQRENRLVVHVLIDGQEPDLTQMGTVRKIALCDHTFFVETADPSQLATQALSEVEHQLEEADRLRRQASDLILQNQNQNAMQRLSGCFSIWMHAQESVTKTAQLMRIDLRKVRVTNTSLTDWLDQFSQQLHQIKSALESRDFVALNDILTYEADQTSQQWQIALGAVRRAIAGVH